MVWEDCLLTGRKKKALKYCHKGTFVCEVRFSEQDGQLLIKWQWESLLPRPFQLHLHLAQTKLFCAQF